MEIAVLAQRVPELLGNNRSCGFDIGGLLGHGRSAKHDACHRGMSQSELQRGRSDRDAVGSAEAFDCGNSGQDGVAGAVDDKVGVPAGEVRTLDRVYQWDQRSQGLLLDVEHPTLGRITLPGPPLRLDGGERDHVAPPTLGQHNDSVRAWLDELEALNVRSPL
jgi:crotonobetainyl-CoA:carnitine CoA-transferase CaiB-like acyl-CoA transferase